MRETLTFYIIGISIFAFILELIFSNQFLVMFSLVPSLAILQGYIWQFITYMFIHADFMHLFLNMFALFIFGLPLENYLGSRTFLLFYIGCGLGSALLHILLTGISKVLLLGASGAVFGVLTAYGILWPRNIIYVYFVPMPAIVAVILFGILEFLFGISGVQPGIAHFGHLGGILTAIIPTLYLRKKRAKEYWYRY